MYKPSTIEKMKMVEDAIKGHFKKTGRQPTIRELTKIMNFSTTSLTDRYIRILVKEKRLEIYSKKFFYPTGFRKKIMELARKEWNAKA